MKQIARTAAVLSACIGVLMGRAFATDLAEVLVVGDDASGIHGSASVLDKEALIKSHPFTANEALRKLPGVSARDEEGFGMRPNVGIRGLNPTRSTKITMLEDGVPLSYAPYGDNASYYHPPIDRFERVEVLKGAAQTAFGPQTIGGTLNYITQRPSQDFGGLVSVTLGNRGYANGKFRIEGRGMMLDYMRKQGDGARDNIHSGIHDLNYKIVADLGERHAITVRSNYFAENSMVTYSGLTEAEYRNFGARYNPFKNDEFDGRRFGNSLTHEIALGQATLTTNLYLSFFRRNWWRQSSTTTDTQGGAAGTAFRNDRLAGLAVNPDALNSTQGRLRNYTTGGVEPKVKFKYDLAQLGGELEAGIKVHMEEQERKQINGSSPTARSGAIAEDNLRRTEAYSTFLSNKFIFGRFSVTPGIRLEHIKSQRTDLRFNTSGSDCLTEWVPGVGMNWNPVDPVTLFTGVHRGFAPPRTEDIISGSGTSTEVGPEDSVNFEFGFRARPTEKSSVQAAYFRNDFRRLIAVGSIAGGSTPLAEGEALFQGVEFSGDYAHASGIYTSAAYTYLPTAEQTTPFREVSSRAIVGGSREGARQPYSPEHLLTASLGFARAGFDAQVESVYISRQFANFSNTTLESADGQSGTVPENIVWNAALNYTIRPLNVTLFAAVKNIADLTYIVDRTRGILTGSPRLVQGGVKYEF